MTTIPSLLTITDLPDQQPNVPGSYTHTEYNLMKNNYLTMIAFVRSLVDPDTGLILASVLPPSPLDPAQFEDGDNGFIQLINYSAIGGGTALPATTVTTGTITDTAIQLNWTAVASATGYQPQQLIGSAWTNAGSAITALTLTINGLTASTAYSFRVKTVPAEGYLASTSNPVNASTVASGGGITLTPISGNAATGGQWIVGAVNDASVSGTTVTGVNGSASVYAKLQLPANTAGTFRATVDGCGMGLNTAFEPSNESNTPYRIVQNPESKRFQCTANDVQIATDGSYDTPQVCDIQMTKTAGANGFGQAIFIIGGQTILTYDFLTAPGITYPNMFNQGQLTLTQESGFIATA